MKTTRHATRIVGVLLTATMMQACSDGYDAPSAPTDAARNGAAATAAPAPRILRVIGKSGDLTAALNDVRTLLGELNAPGGRREIGWDGGPPTLANNDVFPGDAFLARGVIFSSSTGAFRVSDNDLVDINPTYGAQFNAFSPLRTFLSIGTNVLDANFFVPGTNTPALSKGFVVLFSDVDRVLTTKLEYFDASNRRIGVAFAPRRTDAVGHSLAGIVYDAPVVARVRITVGQAAVGATVNDVSNGGTQDVAVMDDWLFGEPQPR
jgi:hypothetical protein